MCIVLYYEYSSLSHSGMACANEGSHTCRPSGMNHTCLYFPATTLWQVVVSNPYRVGGWVGPGGLLHGEVLCPYIDSVADNSDVNHMTASNLALVFGPTLMKQNKWVLHKIVSCYLTFFSACHIFYWRWHMLLQAILFVLLVLWMLFCLHVMDNEVASHKEN